MYRVIITFGNRVVHCDASDRSTAWQRAASAITMSLHSETILSVVEVIKPEFEFHVEFNITRSGWDEEEVSNSIRAEIEDLGYDVEVTRT